MRVSLYMFLLFLISCQSRDRFVIQGNLPDKTFDGEMIYLVPLENAVKERVDSAVIKDGKFRMEGSAQSTEIFILRAKPVLRLKLQELLVVKEPGTLTAIIGENSLVTGTAMNDSLQRWKDKKIMADYVFEELKQKYKIADKVQKAVLKQAADSINKRTVDFNYRFVRYNKDNVVGKFVYKLSGSAFTPEQQLSLNMH